MSEQDKANNAAERFSMPRKEFIQPSRPLVTPTLKRDNAPAIPVSQLPPLPALALPSFGTPVVREKKERAKRQSKETPVVNHAPMVLYGPEHVCTDEEFIIKTRAHSIHDPGIKELFFANGGEEIVDKYDTLAQAFDALRRHKTIKRSGALNVTAETPLRSRTNQIDTSKYHVYQKGSHEEAQRIRDRARDDADRRRKNEEWINGGKKE